MTNRKNISSAPKKNSFLSAAESLPDALHGGKKNWLSEYETKCPEKHAELLEFATEWANGKHRDKLPSALALAKFLIPHLKEAGINRNQEVVARWVYKLGENDGKH